LVLTAALLVNNRMMTAEQARTKTALDNERQRASEARRAVDLFVEIAEQELADQPNLVSVRKRFLESALGYYRDFVETHGNDPSVQAELQAGNQRVQNILDELNTLEGINLVSLAIEQDVQRDMKVSETQGQKLKELDDNAPERRMQHYRKLRSL